MTAHLRVALASIMLTAGCRSTPSPDPAPSPMGVPKPPSSAPAVPASTSARAGEPPALVKRLMEGRLEAGTFPVVVTDPGRPYDAKLYDRLTTVRVPRAVSTPPPESRPPAPQSTAVPPPPKGSIYDRVF